jgi:hypothetical protein
VPQVTAARINPDGSIEKVMVGSIASIERALGEDLDFGNLDDDYNRELGVWVYYVFAPQARREPNVFASWLMQGYYEGSVVIVSDRNKDGSRNSEGYRSLSKDWFDPNLQEIVRICNTQSSSIAVVAKQRPY